MPYTFPDICLIAGLAGTGKTTAAELLANWLNAQGCRRAVITLDQDDIRAALAAAWRASGRLDAAAPIPTSRTHPDFTHTVYERLWAEMERAAQAGAHVIIAASFKNPDNQQDFARRWPALANKYHARALWLTASQETAVARTIARQRDPQNKSDQGPDDVARQYETAATQNLTLAPGWIAVNTDPPAGAGLGDACAKTRFLGALLEACSREIPQT